MCHLLHALDVFNDVERGDEIDVEPACVTDESQDRLARTYGRVYFDAHAGQPVFQVLELVFVWVVLQDDDHACCLHSF